MLPTPNRPEPIGHINGEPIYAIDAIEVVRPTTQQPASEPSGAGPELEEILSDLIEIVEDLEVVHGEIINEIKRATSMHERTPEMSINHAGIVTSLNRRAAVAGIILIHLKASLGTADQVLR